MRDGRLHAAGENKELADKAVEHGQAGNRKRGDDEERDHPGKLCGKAAVIAHVVGAVALIEDAEQHEERAAADAFIDGGVDSAVNPRNSEAKDPEDDNADVPQGAVGGKLFEVFLDERDERTIDD